MVIISVAGREWDAWCRMLLTRRGNKAAQGGPGDVLRPDAWGANHFSLMVILVDKAQLIKEVQDCTDAFIATIEWRTEEGLEVLEVLPTKYHKWVGIFHREQTNKLPEYTKYDHKITLVEGTEAPWGPLYGMTEQELRGLQE